MIRRLMILCCVFLSCGANASADEPTTIYSAAARPDGGQNVFVVSQPDNLENPLGNPIVGPEVAPKVFDSLPQIQQVPQNTAATKVDNAPHPVGTINDTPVQEGLALGKDFQNTLVEGNGRVYDIQSYPLKDINVMSNPAEPQTIYSPNVNAP